MKKQKLIDMYVKEIIQAEGDVEQLQKILDIIIDNTERSLRDKVCSNMYDTIGHVRTLKAWD